MEVYEFGDGWHLKFEGAGPLLSSQINFATDYPIFVSLVQVAMEVGIAAVLLSVGLWLMSSIKWWW